MKVACVPAYAILLLCMAAVSVAQVAYAPTVPTDKICGHCCHEGTFCQPTAAPTTLARAAGGLPTGHIIPAATSLTCYQRDRDQPGAIDGGLCIPSTGVPNITTFCSALSGSPTAQVVPTVYEANLQEQQSTCSPCCEGKHVCSFGLKCAEVEGSDQGGGVCVPEGQDSPAYCSGVTLSKAIVSCESCDAYTPIARQMLSMQSAFSRRFLAEAQSAAGTGSSAGGASSRASAGSSAQSTGGQASSGSSARSAAETDGRSSSTQSSAASQASAGSSRAAPVSTPAATSAPTRVATPAPTNPATPSPTQTAAPFATPAPTPYPTGAATPVPTTPAANPNQNNQGFNPQNNPQPVQNRFPPFQNNFPPFQNRFPPSQNYFPPNRFPPFQNYFPPNPFPPGGKPPGAPGPRLG